MKFRFLNISALSLLFLPLAVRAYSFLDESGLKKTADGTGHANLKIFGGNANLVETIGRFIEILLSFVGVIFLILTIYGGFKWMTARGNEQEVTKAQDLLKNAAVGLAIVLLAYGLTFLIVLYFATPFASYNYVGP
jgi:hypothetical protein